MPPIYLDYNTTTPLAPSVLEAMHPFWCEHFLLPSQEHQQGRAIGEGIERAREQVAELVGCDSFEIVFTDGGTEANNLAILGMADAKAPGHILVSILEHESVLLAAESLMESGWKVDQIPCDPNGVISVDAVESRLQPDTELVCVQAANPILGTLQPIRDIAEVCHKHDVRLHCDATQMFGKMPVDVSSLGADTMSVSGHKFYGPKGTGALFVRRGLSLKPFRFGEPREMGLRPGAENIPGIIGLGAASLLASRCADQAADRLEELSQRFLSRLRETVDPELQIVCEDSARLPNTLTLLLPTDARRVQKMADRLIMATARSASPPDQMTRSLSAIGLEPNEISRALRISLGWNTSQDQVDRSVELLAETWEISTP